MTTMTRDIIAEARSWRAQILGGHSQSSEELRSALGMDDLSEEALVWAYNSWWEAYTEGVRESQREASSYGLISRAASRAAGLEADGFALRELRELSSEG